MSSFETDNMLRFIIVTTKITNSNTLNCFHIDKCLWATTVDFKISEKEIKLAAESSKIVLSKQDIKELISFSEGWLVAVNLCLQSYMQSGSIYSIATLYEYIDSELLKGYSNKMKRNLAKLAIVSEFSMELAAAICEDSESIDFILDNEMNNIIIKKVGYNKYFFSNMLRDFLAYYLNKYEDNKERLYHNAGQWYISNDMPIKAMSNYLNGGMFEEILEIIRNSENSYMDIVPSLIQDIYQKMPHEYNRKYPYLYLRYISDCMTNIDYYNGTKLLEKFKEDLDSGKYDGDQKQLEGEYYYVRAFSKFNDVSDMMADFHLAYDCFDGGKSMVAYPNMVATFGSCHLLYLYHRDSGELASLVKKIQREVGYYVHISYGVNAGSGKLVEAEYNFETGNYENVLSLAKSAYQEAYLSKQTSICIASLFLEGRYRILQKDYIGSESVIDNLIKIRDNLIMPILLSEIDCALGYLYILLNRQEDVALWIKDSESRDVSLLHEAASLTYVILMVYHLSNQNYDVALSAAEYLENYCEHQMHVFGLVYAKLGKFVIFHHARDKVNATSNLLELVLLASNDNISTIFVESSRLLGPVIDFYDIADPHFKLMKDLVHRSNDYGKIIDESLTAKEIEVIKEFVKSKTVQEAADKMCISKNTIKTHLKKIYSKLGVCSKEELVKLIINDNMIN